MVEVITPPTKCGRREEIRVPKWSLELQHDTTHSSTELW
jgi:hypothetical protein